MTDEDMCQSPCGGSCAERNDAGGLNNEELLARLAMRARMRRIKHKLAVVSGKGGVGKSTVAANLATGLAMAGKRVGLLDVDLHSPCVPQLMHLEQTPMSGEGNDLYPIALDCPTGSLCVVSIGCLLREREDVIIWNGPMKFALIEHLLKDVEWGALDYLIVDCPPGTGDELLAVAQLVENADGVLVVTTPQQLALQSVRLCIAFCRQIELPVLGLVENMRGFVCPKCAEAIDLFGSDGGRALAEQTTIPYLGAIPVDPEVIACSDRGIPIVRARPQCATSKAYRGIVRELLDLVSRADALQPTRCSHEQPSPPPEDRP